MASLTKSPRRLAGLLAVIVLAVIASGCGTQSADTVRGRQLFLTKCATCHSMAEAGQGSNVGPNLDDAFAAARASGQDSDTIEGVTISQIEYPRPSTDNPAVSMPANLVTGQDARDVAAYVAEYAGVPGAAPPKVPGGPGAQVFANNLCGSCHVLEAAKSGGVTGPSLDEVLPGMSAAMIRQSIVEPNEIISQGYPADVMPQNYDETIPPEDLDQLVDYLLSSTSGGQGGGQGGGAGSGGNGG